MISRRDLLGALLAAPLAMRAASAASAEPSRLFVMIFLYGGNDNYNTWIPYADSNYRRFRPHIAIERDSVIKITEHHGFHPSLAPLMPAWDARELALVQGIGYPQGTQQHYRDCDTAFTGCDGQDYSREGWVTRALASRARVRRLDAIAFDALDVRAADPMGPFRGGKLAALQVFYAQDLLAKRRLRECAFEINARAREAIGPEETLAPVDLKTRFPEDPFGRAMRATVEVAALDRTLPVVHVTLNGLDEDKHHSVDCHWNQLAYHGDALARLAGGLASLRNGLIEIGRWSDTLVATYDEFGRSPMENEDRGTHHGLATTHFVLGGRVKGGLVGEAPPFERMWPIGGPDPTIDTRRLWTTVAERWWGVNAGELFPRRHAPLDLIRA